MTHLDGLYQIYDTGMPVWISRIWCDDVECCVYTSQHVEVWIQGEVIWVCAPTWDISVYTECTHTLVSAYEV